MTKTFIYMVNGNEYTDTKAFGQAWKDAKAQATADHTMITRLVINGEDERCEFFAKGGVFLNERFYTEEKAFIF